LGGGISRTYPLGILRELGFLRQPGSGVLQCLQVSQHELRSDGLDIALRGDIAVDVADIGLGEDPHYLADGIVLADVRKELVAQALARGRAPYQASDVHESDSRRHNPS